MAEEEQSLCLFALHLVGVALVLLAEYAGAALDVLITVRIYPVGVALALAVVLGSLAWFVWEPRLGNFWLVLGGGCIAGASIRLWNPTPGGWGEAGVVWLAPVVRIGALIGAGACLAVPVCGIRAIASGRNALRATILLLVAFLATAIGTPCLYPAGRFTEDLAARRGDVVAADLLQKVVSVRGLDPRSQETLRTYRDLMEEFDTRLGEAGRLRPERVALQQGIAAAWDAHARAAADQGRVAPAVALAREAVALAGAQLSLTGTRAYLAEAYRRRIADLCRQGTKGSLLEAVHMRNEAVAELPEFGYAAQATQIAAAWRREVRAGVVALKPEKLTPALLAEPTGETLDRAAFASMNELIAPGVMHTGQKFAEERKALAGARAEVWIRAARLAADKDPGQAVHMGTLAAKDLQYDPLPADERLKWLATWLRNKWPKQAPPLRETPRGFLEEAWRLIHASRGSATSEIIKIYENDGVVIATNGRLEFAKPPSRSTRQGP